MGKRIWVPAMVGLVMAMTSPLHAGETNGSGSTFVFPILSKWATEYQAKTGDKVNYQSNGSGAGLQQVKAGAVDFGASDMPLRPDQLVKAGLGQFPLVIGGVVPVVNIEGIGPGRLRFTGSVLADIFLGKIKNWDDPALKRLNPDLALPDAPITVVHRTDGSGTTFNFANYLSKVSPEWKEKVGEGVAVEWPTGVGGKGNEGVAAYVVLAKNSVSYVEYAYAIKNKLAYGLVQNHAGRFVQPGAETFQAAAASAAWENTQDFYRIMTDAPGENAYPITATSFVLMPKQPKDHGRAKIALDFFRWSLENGQADAGALNYVPLPVSLIEKIERYWKSDFGA
ncbi:phosphate ABC transporter substrate-binding protein PstS [Bradyrhizobium genosp. P]|uniref:phosphate ABC transporter substrate-binding protein PstS n=1 Tax=Bradyrhizobium genosp. P TaxID=83641 RepID=UPI003CF2A729